MADFKATLFFTMGEHGWSESAYINAGDHSTAMTQLEQAAFHRRKTLPTNCRIKHARVVAPDPQRDAAFHTFTGDTGKGTWPIGPDAGDPSEIAEAAVNWRLFAGVGKWRTYLMRGVPSNAVGRIDNILVVTQSYQDKAMEFLSRLINSSFRIRTLLAGAPQNIESVAIQANRIWSFNVTAVPVGTVAGGFVKVSEVQGVSFANGIWKVQLTIPAGAPAVNVKRKLRNNYGTIPVGVPGKMQALTPTYEGITDVQLVTVTARKTGRPSYLPRGRSAIVRG